MESSEEQLKSQLAKKLIQAVENDDFKTVELFMSHGFPLDYRLNFSEMQLYSLLMCREITPQDVVPDSAYYRCLL